MNKTKLPKGVTEDQFKAWQDEYGKDELRLATLAKNLDESETLDVVVRVPDRETYNIARKYMDTDVAKGYEIIINACLLSHKDEVKANKYLYYSCEHAMSQLIPLRKAIVSKF